MCAVLHAHGIPEGRLQTLGGSSTAPLGTDLIVSTAAVRSEFGARLSNVYAPVVLASFGRAARRPQSGWWHPTGPPPTGATCGPTWRSGPTRATSCCITPGSMLHGPRRELAAGQVDSRLLAAFAAMARLYRVDVVDFRPGRQRNELGHAAAGRGHRPGGGDPPPARTVTSLALFMANQLAEYQPTSSKPVRLAEAAGTARRVRRAQPPPTAQPLNDPEQTSTTVPPSGQNS